MDDYTFEDYLPNASNHSDSVDTRELDEAFVVFYCSQLFFSLACIVTNVQVLCVLVSNWKMRFAAKSYILITSLAVADLLVGIAYFGISILRLTCIFLYGHECGGTQLFCAWVTLPMLLGVNSSMVFSFVIGLDRLAAAVAPLWYKTHADRTIWLVNSVAWLWTLTEVGLKVVGPTTTLVLPRCTVLGSMVEEYGKWSSAYGVTINVITILLYLVLFVITRHKKVGISGGHGHHAADKVQERITRSIKIVMLVYAITSGSSRLLYWAYNRYLPKAVRPRYGTPTRNLQLINSAANFFIFLATNSSFTTAWKKMFLCRASRADSATPTVANSAVHVNTASWKTAWKHDSNH